MEERSILILDCTSEKDPREGLMLKHFFNIIKAHKPSKSKPLYYRTPTLESLKNKLRTPKQYDIIHISAHGYGDGIGNRVWQLKADDISKLKTDKIKAQLIHVSACGCCNKTMADAFNSKYYLAPITEVDWIDAATFSTLFYKRYLVDGVSMRSSFEFARRHTKTCKDYPNYWAY